MNPELIQMLELADKDIKAIIIPVFCMFKKLRRDTEYIRTTQIELLEMNTTLYEIKNTLGGSNNQSRL